MPETTAAPPMTLSIAGSEATGGAGAQADLKTFQELGTFGMVALTCIVSFNPQDEWTHRFVPIETQVIEDQIEAIFGNYGPDMLDTVKLGMMGSPGTISSVAAAIAARRPRHLVLDPVLICKGQEPGHAQDTDNALKAELLPLATFVTPNHFETEQLSGMKVETLEDLQVAAAEIHRLSGAAVLAKGGVRLAGTEALDVYVDAEGIEVLRAPKIGEHAVSGAGCSLAAAVAAGLAKGSTPRDAARRAKEFVTAGIRQRVAGNTPFDALWQGGLRG